MTLLWRFRYKQRFTVKFHPHHKPFMKKKSASQSAFFNPRVLIGMCVILAGAGLALFAANPFGRSTTAPAAGKTNQSQTPITLNTLLNLKVFPAGFDCSKVHQLGIDKQDNMLAGLIMIACGYTEGGSAEGSASSGNAFSQWVRSLLPEPLFIGSTDVDVILPDGTFPHVTQSESMEWGNGNNTWVVNYNDSRTAPSCYSGISYSTDNGV
ncbi:MAG TPA: hypothetical protein VGH37_03390, partial [Candidatus Acidoferrum sp.]